MNFDNSQIDAINNVLKRESSIITGGAGTGKTTIMAELVKRMGGNAELLTPTGKAAARLREMIKLPASTIHRWLGWNGVDCMRSATAGTPLIIDEASMLDSWLLWKVLSYKPPKIILVGDAAQLQPVGKGSPFHDLHKYCPEIVSTITHCYRSKAAVHIAATDIRNGICPELKLDSGGEVFNFAPTRDAEQAERQMLDWVHKGEYDPEQDVILSCRNGETIEQYGTVMSLNKKIVDIVNPRDKGQEKQWQFRDRVMNLKNDAQLDWYNGDTGVINGIDSARSLWIIPDREKDREIIVKEKGQDQLIHAYALTVHKAQGSQYRRVFFLILQDHQNMITRNLIYTGVTRAKEACIIVGQINALKQGINRTDTKKTVIQLYSKKVKEYEALRVRGGKG